METYIGTFTLNNKVVTEIVYNSDKIVYTRKYTVGTSSNYSDHSALFIEHIFSNREDSICEYNLWREYSSINKNGLKALEMMRIKL